MECDSQVEYRLLPVVDEVEPVIEVTNKFEQNNTENSNGVVMLPIKELKDIRRGLITKGGEICCQIRVTTTPIVRS